MELLIDETRPPFRVSGLEGEAVFSYGMGDAGAGGQVLIQMVALQIEIPPHVVLVSASSRHRCRWSGS